MSKQPRVTRRKPRREMSASQRKLTICDAVLCAAFRRGVSTRQLSAHNRREGTVMPFKDPDVLPSLLRGASGRGTSPQPSLLRETPRRATGLRASLPRSPPRRNSGPLKDHWRDEPREAAIPRPEPLAGVA
jgi:hypothetical protein